MKRESIIGGLREIPELIRQNEIQLLNLENELAELRKKMARWRDNEMSKIAQEVDESGRRRFSNAALRNSELSRRKDASEEWHEMEERSQHLNHEIGMAKIELNYQYNRLRVGIAIAQLESEGVRKVVVPEVPGKDKDNSLQVKQISSEDPKSKVNPSALKAQTTDDRSSTRNGVTDYWERIRRKMEEFAAPGDQVTLLDQYRSETPLKCRLCGHPEIININVIKNKRTGEVLKIGSVCVTKYEKVRKKYLPSLSRIQVDQRVRITRKPGRPYYDDLWRDDRELIETLSGEYGDEQYDIEFDPSIDWGPAEDDPEEPKWYGGVDSPFPDP